MSEIKFLLSLMFFLAFLGFMMTLVPSEYQFISAFDFVWFAGGIIGVAGTCAIATGLPCAGALAIFGIATIWNYIIISVEWLKLLIFTPIVVTLIYLIAKLGRGGG